MNDKCKKFRDTITEYAKENPGKDGKVLTVNEYDCPVDPISGIEDKGTVYEFTYVDPKDAKRENDPEGYNVYNGEEETIYELR